MSFSFRNMFSKDDENASNDAGASNPDDQQPFINPRQYTGDGNFQAMFDHSSGNAQAGMPMEGGAGADPRGVSLMGQMPAAAAPGIKQHYLASELLAFIPPAIAPQAGIPMEQTIAIGLPADGSTDVRLSTICAACPQLFAVEITPLNDSVITLPPRLAAAPQPQAAPQASGMDLASMRANTGGSLVANNPFAGAAQSPIHPQNTGAPAAGPPQAPAAAASPFGAPPAEPTGTPSQFGFPEPPAAAAPDAQSAFSPFGAPPQAAPMPQPAPTPVDQSGATPTVGFSAIGPIPDSNEGGGNIFGPTPQADSIFPAGNPFDEPAAAAPASPPQAESPANPFGESGAFGAPASAAARFATPEANPFDSSASYSTIFSEKAQEDEQKEVPGIFGSPVAPDQAVPAQAVVAFEPVNAPAPQAELPTIDEALPPQAAGSPNPFAQFEASPASEQPNPFGQLDAAPIAEQPSFEDELPHQSIESPTPPFGQPAATSFEPPTVAPEAANLQLSPFHSPEAPAEMPAPAAAPPAEISAFDAGESDSFDDLSPFTAAVGARNSFFDEISNSEPASRAEVQGTAPIPEDPKATASPAPEAAPVPEMVPAPFDSVVKNVELRAVFGTNEEFTPESVAVKIVGIDGIATCAVQSGAATSQAVRAGQPTMALSQIKSLSESAKQIAALSGVADACAFTIHTDKGLISIFSHESATVFVRHLSGEFDPGVREKLMLITRGVASL